MKQEQILILTGQTALEKHVLEPLLDNHYQLRFFESFKDVVNLGIHETPTCLLSGMQSQERLVCYDILQDLQHREILLPAIFVDSNWNIEQVVSVMKQGASNFLRLPVKPERLLNALQLAMDEFRGKKQQAHEVTNAKSRIASLNKREHDVVRLLLNGRLNKEIADEMNLALVTIKMYRSRAMKKLNAGNASELARIAMLGGMTKRTEYAPAREWSNDPASVECMRELAAH